MNQITVTKRFPSMNLGTMLDACDTIHRTVPIGIKIDSAYFRRGECEIKARYNPRMEESFYEWLADLTFQFSQAR
jgi:hypothetical protein